jgi:hypothetical protein
MLPEKKGIASMITGPTKHKVFIIWLFKETVC